MQKTFEIATTKHWKALGHPLRLGILDELRRGERTNEELAKALGVESGKLYFHTKQLLTAGMIELAGTRQKGPITEKLYRVVAQRFYAPPPTPDGDHAPFADLMASALSLYLSTWREDPGSLDRLNLGYHLTASLPKERIREMVAEIRQIAERAMVEDSDEGSIPVALTILLHGLPDRKENPEG